MASTDSSNWNRIETSTEFADAFADKPLIGEGIQFVIHADGRISGSIGELPFSGNWYWSDGYFCRTATFEGEDLGLDCEIIEQRGHQMRYTRDKGRGDVSVVDIMLP
ncbi:MAG: hypothetical protein V3V25_12735 [Paracoccaceae bacterium]